MLPKARLVVVADYQERIVPSFPTMGIDEFCERWSASFATVSAICGVDYRTVTRARDRYRKDGTVNDLIWMRLGLTDLVWRQGQSAA